MRRLKDDKDRPIIRDFAKIIAECKKRGYDYKVDTYNWKVVINSDEDILLLNVHDITNVTLITNRDIVIVDLVTTPINAVLKAGGIISLPNFIRIYPDVLLGRDEVVKFYSDDIRVSTKSSEYKNLRNRGDE